VTARPRVRVIDLNADLGEGAGTDDALMGVITSANIACGVHAGDPQAIRHAVGLALTRGVGIGAHPSFPDREGSGRRPMAVPPDRVGESIAAQIRTVADAARAAAARLQHVKAHGALYNQAVGDPVLAGAIGEAVRRVDGSVIIVALAGSPMVTVLRSMGLRVAQEAFIDRAYTAEGTLVPRDRPGALVADLGAAVGRAVRLVSEGTLTASDGRVIRVDADTLCIHGDTPQAAALARAVRQALEDAGVTVARLDAFL